jgi:formylglycine-generating enzyme
MRSPSAGERCRAPVTTRTASSCGRILNSKGRQQETRGLPATDTGEDGFKGTAPVASFPANGYGLFDMTGNVWRHVSDWYRADTYREQAREGVARNPAGPANSFDPDDPQSPKHVIRGGSFLCSEAFCFSYRPAARMKLSPDSALPNVGFRLVKTP